MIPLRSTSSVLHDVVFEHPQFDRAALAAQRDLPRLSGTHRTYYAGAYFGFGFHEDGMRAGVTAAARAMADAVGTPTSSLSTRGLHHSDGVTPGGM